jgi:hypothetical protein
MSRIQYKRRTQASQVANRCSRVARAPASYSQRPHRMTSVPPPASCANVRSHLATTPPAPAPRSHHLRQGRSLRDGSELLCTNLHWSFRGKFGTKHVSLAAFSVIRRFSSAAEFSPLEKYQVTNDLCIDYCKRNAFRATTGVQSPI